MLGCPTCNLERCINSESRIVKKQTKSLLWVCAVLSELQSRTINTEKSPEAWKTPPHRMLSAYESLAGLSFPWVGVIWLLNPQEQKMREQKIKLVPKDQLSRQEIWGVQTLFMTRNCHPQGCYLNEKKEGVIKGSALLKEAASQLTAKTPFPWGQSDHWTGESCWV